MPETIKIPCPFGCGAECAPRGMARHKTACPRNPSRGLQLAPDHDISARLRERIEQKWRLLGGKLQDAYDSLPDERPDERLHPYTNVHQAVELAHAAFGQLRELLEILEGKGNPT